jgi:hypothetical protein
MIDPKNTVGWNAIRHALSMGLLIAASVLSPYRVLADSESPFCSLPADPSEPWLPNTPLPHEHEVPSPRPASDCQFYRPSWQRFLLATQPVGGVPAFLRYPTFDQLFGLGTPAGTPHAHAQQAVVLSLLPRNIQRPNNPTARQQKLLDDVQAGLGGKPGGILIDQRGRFLYYAIHVNPAFQQFLQNQNLTTVPGIQNIDPSLTFLGSDSDIATGADTNIAEYKSAWMVVDKRHPPSNYFVVPARIPHYIVSGTSLVQDTKNGQPLFDSVRVALIAMHVVFTLPGHPEMIWSTFEHVHVDGTGNAIRDNAPAASDNPPLVPATAIVSTQNYPLYKANTAVKDANQPIDLATIVQYWNTTTQSFVMKDGTPVQTSVYRPYPGSKTDGSKANPNHSEDDEILRINNHATAMFKAAEEQRLISLKDKRANYRLVGAIWLNQPSSGPNPSFTVKQSFVIASDQSTDDPGQAIAGEGRLGSTAMESFTEFEDAAPNCFSCHDTEAVNDKRQVMPPARLNVTHVLSKFMNLQPAPKP